MKTIDINLLPQNVQDTVRDGLTVQTVMYVEYEDGEYTAHYGLVLDTRVKAPDFTTYEFKNTDVYTDTEVAGHIKVLNDMHAKQPDSFWD